MAAMDVVDVLLWMSNVSVAISIAVCSTLKLVDEVSGLVVLCQCLVAFPVFSVMTIRATQETPFRPGDAKTLEEEFAVYGYPSWFFKMVRVTKASLAVFLVWGLVWTPGLLVGAGGILILMIGAVGSHIKVGDPVQRSVPSFTLGCMCACMLWAYKQSCIVVTSGDDVLSILASEAARWWLCTAFSLAFIAMVATVLNVKDALFWLGNVGVAAAIVAAALTGRKAEAAGLLVLCQCLVAFPVFSVMTIRATQETPFRPGDAKTLEEEFAVYGYPSWFFKMVRVTKASLAVLLVVGLVWTPGLLVGAGGILVLMVGAVFSHIKVGDPVQKSVPSFTLGCMCTCMLVAYALGCTHVTVTKGAGPPSAFAAKFGRETAFATMIVAFMVCMCQMVVSECLAPKVTSAREALLPS